MKSFKTLFLSSTLFLLPGLTHSEDNPVVEAMQEYMEFASYTDGTITKAQMESLGLENLLLIDARSVERFEEKHLPNAVNIEWRQVLNHMDEIPIDKTVVLYCDSGLLSSKTHFALKLAGYENVRVLLGGYASW